MDDGMSRRTFLKAAGASVVGAMAAPLMSSASAEEAPQIILDGKSKFSGTAFTRALDNDWTYIGVSDRRTALFENVYPIPRGVSYNSYLLMDDKTVLMDTADRSVGGQFLENLIAALGGRQLDYLVVQHMEPDHCAMIPEVLRLYPNAKIVCSALAMTMIGQFFDFDASKYGMTVKEGDVLQTGNHSLCFIEAPMVHWPEVLMTFDINAKTLFSADGFGSFGALNGNLYADEVNFETEWIADARRYYTNIVGKYGLQVAAVLEKAAPIGIERICPLHGPIWRENIGWILDKYVKWATYEPEDKEVAVFYGSIYGGTENAANLLAAKLSQLGLKHVNVYDVSKTHVSELIAESFRCSHLVFASITYNMNVFTPMKNFINDLAAHNLQNRHYALIENGSWSPVAAQHMQAILDGMSGLKQIGDTVTIRSTTNTASGEALTKLAETIYADVTGEVVVAEAAEEAPAAAWKCNICGYVYEGDPLPEDFKCPLCGVGPDQFTKI